MNGSNKFLLALIFLFLAAGFSTASDIYIAQNASGGNSGADCADAHAVTWFNSSSNWGSNFGQIGPGTTVHLCGTITSSLTARGSGGATSPVTILFDAATNAAITMPALPTAGAIVLDGLSYIVVDGNNQAGVIQATDNGSPQGGYGNQVDSRAISADGGTNIEVRYLRCSNVYVHTSSSDSNNGNYESCVHAWNTPNLTVDNNIMHDCAWCISVGGSNTSVHDNTIYNFDHGLGMGIQSAAQVLGPVYFYNNTLHDTANWDTVNASYHHDGIHLWAFCSDGSSFCAGTYWNKVYIYNNHLYGNWGVDNSGMMFFQGNTHNAWIFNNFVDASGSNPQGINDGEISVKGNNIRVVNNTCFGPGNNAVSSSVCVQTGGPEVSMQSNVLVNSNQLAGTSGFDYAGINPTTYTALGNDVYMRPGSNAWVWCASGTSNCIWTGSFSTWIAASGETSAKSDATVTVNPNGTLQSGSPAIGAAANLHAICNGQPIPGLGALYSDAAGNARPTAAAWDAGAFSYQSSNPPSPPSNLQASVQ